MSQDLLLHKRLLIHGRVQGVFYRVSTQQEAEKLGLRGWVKNLPNGSVEVEVHGSPSAVAALLAWCQHGPPGARVEKIDSNDCPPAEYTGFQVIRP
ncbi:acylphosphatase [Candidatus Magnetaquicoccus inordinatus]|uniref:acylphosphatase n=1 Tax=Candidatus Magnetaquicoccus inordinatus TaxID=2496818 RepID=UPI00102BB5AA|nr:acylphosphatase [Candidatus Magnetaquicoccus inordinatus]